MARIVTICGTALQREFLSTNSEGAAQWPVIDSRSAGIPEDIHWSRESNFIDPQTQLMKRKQLQIAIKTLEDAIAALQARLESGEFSRAARAKLERDILNRVHLRYIAMRDLRELGSD